MTDIINLIKDNLGTEGIKKLSEQIGDNEENTEKGLNSAVTSLLGGIINKNSDEKSARSLLSILDRDHDGSILDDIGGFLGKGDTNQGEGILKHALGDKQETAASSVSETSGLSLNSSNKLMSMVAPLVMGAISKKSSESGDGKLNLGSLMGLLSNEKSNLLGQGGPLSSLATKFLDKDGDGSIVDDIAGGFIKNIFSKKK